MKVHIQLLSDGLVEMETEGVSGPQCLGSMAGMASLLPGSEIVDSNLKTEYFLNEDESLSEQICMNEVDDQRGGTE